MPEHPYGWLSLIPPVAAIALAILTQRVVLALLVGIFSGALLMTGGDPVQALCDTLEVHLWTTLIEVDKLRVFCFTLLMGAMWWVLSIGPAACRAWSGSFRGGRALGGLAS